MTVHAGGGIVGGGSLPARQYIVRMVSERGRLFIYYGIKTEIATDEDQDDSGVERVILDYPLDIIGSVSDVGRLFLPA